MKQNVIKLAIASVIIAIAATISVPARPPPSKLKLSQVRLDSSWLSLVQPEFIGCPNLMHASQDGSKQAVEAIWTDSFEAIRIEIEKDALQRDHVATGYSKDPDNTGPRNGPNGRGFNPSAPSPRYRGG